MDLSYSGSSFDAWEEAPNLRDWGPCETDAQGLPSANTEGCGAIDEEDEKRYERLKKHCPMKTDKPKEQPPQDAEADAMPAQPSSHQRVDASYDVGAQLSTAVLRDGSLPDHALPSIMALEKVNNGRLRLVLRLRGGTPTFGVKEQPRQDVSDANDDDADTSDG